MAPTSVYVSLSWNIIGVTRGAKAEVINPNEKYMDQAKERMSHLYAGFSEIFITNLILTVHRGSTDKPRAGLLILCSKLRSINDYIGDAKYFDKTYKWFHGISPSVIK